MTTIKEEKLANGLNVLFADESNRYFGDYHRICILVTLLYPLAELPVDTEDDRAFRDRAVATLGKELKVIKRLERMGVPSAEVEKVRQSLIDSFLESSADYLGRPEYPRSLVAAQLNKRRTYSFYG